MFGFGALCTFWYLKLEHPILQLRSGIFRVHPTRQVNDAENIIRAMFLINRLTLLLLLAGFSLASDRELTRFHPDLDAFEQ